VHVYGELAGPDWMREWLDDHEGWAALGPSWRARCKRLWLHWRPRDRFSVSLRRCDDATLTTILTDLERLGNVVEISESDVAWKASHFAQIAKLRDLESLEVSHVPEAGANVLASLPFLQHFTVDDVRFSDKELSALCRSQSLVSLALRRTSISNGGLEPLLWLQSLEQLELTGTQIDDSAVPVLARLKRLRRLGIAYTRISAGGVAHLRSLLPASAVVESGGSVDDLL
jgi:hypothetical protein